MVTRARPILPDEGYTEYGYRGLDELRAANEKIKILEDKIRELEERLNENQPDTE